MLAVMMIVAVALLVAVSISVFLDVPHGARLRDASGDNMTPGGIPPVVLTGEDRISRKHRRRAPRRGGGARSGERALAWSMRVAADHQLAAAV